MQSLKHIFLRVIFLLLFFGGLNGETAVGGGLFTDSGQNLGSDWSMDVALGDLDGDVDLDAFVVNGPVDSQVWLNQGGEQGGTLGVFADSGQMLNTVNGTAVALGDLDGDTDLDAFVVLEFSTDSHQVWINQGGEQGGTMGVFLRNSHVVNDSPATNVVLADVDGDNDLDAYITQVFSNDWLYLNDGTGLFSDSGQLLEAGDSMDAAFADVDGDTDMDIFVVTQTANEVWVNQGGNQGGTLGVFLDSGQDMGNETSLAVAVADVDGDGDGDAYVANATYNKLWLNQGGLQGGTPGAFADSGQELGFSSSNDIKLADLDGDSDVDAFIAEVNANTVWINQGGLQGGTMGVFQDSGQMLGNSFSRGVALGDVDGDVDLDAFVANSSPAANKLYLNGAGQPPLPVNPEGWQLQEVETRNQTGRYTTLVLDSHDYPHISFAEYSPNSSGENEFLYYEHWDGIRWHKTLIERNYHIGQIISLVLDSRDYPHFLYTTGDTDVLPDLTLKYAYWNGITWQTRVVDSDAEFSRHLSLALDSNDQPHISYIKEMPDGDDELQYAAWSGSVWQIETLVAHDSPQWTSISLVLDNNDRPHMSYIDDAADQLKYAHNNGSGWQIETIDSGLTLTPDQAATLVIDDNNYPHIAYMKSGNTVMVYARWNGTAWQLQTALAAPSGDDFTSKVSLALDSAGNPHISYAYNENDTTIDLRYLFWDGAQWQNEILDNSTSIVGQYSAIALDSNDRPYVSYYEGKYGDLRTLHWGPTWQVHTVADPGQTQAVDIQVDDRSPFLSYHNVSNGLFNITQWQTDWAVNAVTGNTAPITDSSFVMTLNHRHLSYYDSDNQRLEYAFWDGGSWTIYVVDNQGDVGRYQQMVVVGNADTRVRIAYWDATNLQIKLATVDGENGIFEVYPHTTGPALTADSGPLSASVLENGNIGVTYYDGLNGDLRYAVWENESESWTTDELVSGSAADVGRLNALQTDTIDGYPVVAYYDETNDAILVGYRNEGGWQMETAVANAGTVTSLDLELGLGSRRYPRISYTTATDSRFAHKQNGSWTAEIIADGGAPSDGVALTLDNRPHLAYPDASNGLQYVFRTATLDVSMAFTTPTGGDYNPVSPCAIIFLVFFDDDRSAQAMNEAGQTAVTIPSAPLTDLGVFSHMAPLFHATSGGQDYIDLYIEHGAEMGQLGLDDPQLLWDAMGTLQNFLPGLEGLITGNGDRFEVSQEMVDDALDIWQRLAAAGSPALANAINSELAKFNDLQDFVGLSFDEWAEAIGVEPPPEQIYLPLIQAGQ